MDKNFSNLCIGDILYFYQSSDDLFTSQIDVTKVTKLEFLKDAEGNYSCSSFIAITAENGATFKIMVGCQAKTTSYNEERNYSGTVISVNTYWSTEKSKLIDAVCDDYKEKIRVLSNNLDRFKTKNNVK